MDTAKQNVEGHVNENVGKAKAAIGETIGNDKMAAEGHLQQSEGVVQRLGAQIKEKTQAVVEAVQHKVSDQEHE